MSSHLTRTAFSNKNDSSIALDELLLFLRSVGKYLNFGAKILKFFLKDEKG